MHNIRTFIGAMLVAVFLSVVIQLVSSEIDLIKAHCKAEEDKTNAAKTVTVKLDPVDDLSTPSGLQDEQRVKYVLNCPKERVTSCTLVDKDTSTGNYDKVPLDKKKNSVIVTRPAPPSWDTADSGVFVRKGKGSYYGHADSYECSFGCTSNHSVYFTCHRVEATPASKKSNP